MGGALADGRAVLLAAAADAPAAPGVYSFLAAGKLLYVGKATSVRARLRQHAVAKPTSRLHRRYSQVQAVRWLETGTEEAAVWLEGDLLWALRPRFNAEDVRRRYRSRQGRKEAPPPYIVVSEDGLRLAPEGDYGCFPHLGKGQHTRIGIACSDGYPALLRLLWGASGVGTQCPAALTKPAPEVAKVVLPDGLAALLSGDSAAVIDDLLARAAACRPPEQQPGYRRDALAAREFFDAGPRRLRALQPGLVTPLQLRKLLKARAAPLLS